MKLSFKWKILKVDEQKTRNNKRFAVACKESM